MSPAKITLLMTRPEAASRAFVDALPDALREQFSVLISPLIEIRSLETDDMPDFDAAIFTSAHGVSHAPQGRGARAFCVGATTTQRAKDAGWDARQVGQDAQSLVSALIAAPPEGRLLHFSGMHTRGDIAARLSSNGLRVSRVAVYDQVLRPLSQAAHKAMISGPPVIAPLFSPRSAHQFCVEGNADAPMLVAAISDAAAAPCLDHANWTVVVAATPDRAGMQAAVQKLSDTALSA